MRDEEEEEGGVIYCVYYMFVYCVYYVSNVCIESEYCTCLAWSYGVYCVYWCFSRFCVKLEVRISFDVSLFQLFQIHLR